jgi:hypothetical protein
MFTDVHIPFNHIVCLQRQITIIIIKIPGKTFPSAFISSSAFIVSDLETTEECIDDVRIGETYTKTLYGTDRKFLYVHQTPWQKRLLSLYGNEIALLDATYRTTRYSLPLYFLFQQMLIILMLQHL